MPNFQQMPQKPKNLTHNLKLRLLAPKLPNGNWEPSLSVVVTGNNIKIDVWSNRDGDRDKGNVNAMVSPVELLVMLQAINKAATVAANEQTLRLAFQEQQWEGGRPGASYTGATCYIGKDSEDYIYISLVRTNHEPIKFRFMSPKTGNLIGPDGNALDPLVENKMYASAWAKLMEIVVFNTINDTYVPPVPKQKPQQQPQQQQQSAPMKFDESIMPFN